MVMDATKEIAVRGNTNPAGTTHDGFKQFGSGLKAEFPFDAEWTNLNHGERLWKLTASDALY